MPCHSLHWDAHGSHSLSAILCAWRWTAVTIPEWSSTEVKQTVAPLDHPRANYLMTWDTATQSNCRDEVESERMTRTRLRAPGSPIKVRWCLDRFKRRFTFTLMTSFVQYHAGTQGNHCWWMPCTGLFIYGYVSLCNSKHFANVSGAICRTSCCQSISFNLKNKIVVRDNGWSFLKMFSLG